ncbi:tryptophan 7-halogenase [Bradyrhizobium diazoefficiens]|nr:FAD-dependent oxidoreductase [Bradyrhizobium diazoefficiens]MBR0850363.1 tryptophan 7-halogenase [Bradyrhizobium diazoefficiens]
MALELDCDVLIVGGGPAGSAAALRITQLGHSVCLLERRAFPRSHVGEALSGGVSAQLEFLGAAQVLDRVSALRFDHAEVNWRGDGFAHRPMDPRGFSVDRAQFDQLLLEAAQQAGARVIQPATARAAERDNSIWQISAEAEETSLSIRSKFVIDASGRTGFLPRQRRETSPKTLALYGYWRGTGLPETPRVEAGRRQWYWGSPIPGRGFNAIAFVDRDFRNADGATLRQHYHRLIEVSQLLSGTTSARLDDRVLCCDATRFEVRQCCGAGFIKVGEAAFAIDPLSSSGVQAAIQSALAGSVAVHTMLLNPDSAAVAQRFYVRHVEDAASQHATWATLHYAEHVRYAAEAFWRRRAAGARATAARENGTIRHAWRSDDCVVLSSDASVEDVPAIVGDFVVLRPAVSHPALSRPVAFIGGLDLPAFLDLMPPVCTISELEQALASVLPTDGVPAVMNWLLDRGLLEGRSAPRDR